MNSKVSIIILNWNGKNHLQKCLKSIQKVTYNPLEVIVVDNGSLDGSCSIVEEKFPWVKLIKNNKNFGYSKGNNIGIAQSNSKYILILNNDTEVTKDFLAPLVSRMDSNPRIACLQPKILYGTHRDILNAVGSFLTTTGFLYHFGYRDRANIAQYNKSIPIYSAKGAAMLLRKSALDKVGLFDEDFFIFFEETDLCHRLWLAGYTILYEPASIIYHYEALDTASQMKSFTRSYLSFRNRICSYIKNLEISNIVKIFIILIPIYFLLFIVYLITFRVGQSFAVILSILWNIKEFPKTLKKRRFIQKKLRKLDDDFLFRTIKKNPPTFYYLKLFMNSLGTFKV